MKLVDFLICILEAHAQTLQRLAAFFGEDVLLEMLELAGDKEDNKPHPEKSSQRNMVDPIWLEPSGKFHDVNAQAYAALEGAVHEFNLPAMFEFHLWAYPHYRAFIESPLELNSRIRGPGSDAGLELVGEAIAQAEAWIKTLPMPPAISAQAERAAQVPWLRFRTNVLKRIGKRPLGPVY